MGGRSDRGRFAPLGTPWSGRRGEEAVEGGSGECSEAGVLGEFGDQARFGAGEGGGASVVDAEEGGERVEIAEVLGTAGGRLGADLGDGGGFAEQRSDDRGQADVGGGSVGEKRRSSIGCGGTLGWSRGRRGFGLVRVVDGRGLRCCQVRARR